MEFISTREAIVDALGLAENAIEAAGELTKELQKKSAQELTQPLIFRLTLDSVKAILEAVKCDESKIQLQLATLEEEILDSVNDLGTIHNYKTLAQRTETRVIGNKCG